MPKDRLYANEEEDMQTLEKVRANPAEIYDARFVPALFAHWGPIVADAAGVKRGDRVLDVACGTAAATLARRRRPAPRPCRRARREARDAGRGAAQAHAHRMGGGPR
jgi:hypothetical protein